MWRAHPAWIRRESHWRSLVPVDSHLRISLMGLAPSANGEIKTERQRVSRDLAVRRVVLPGQANVTRKIRVRCASFAYIMQMFRAPAARGARKEGCYFWTPLYFHYPETQSTDMYEWGNVSLIPRLSRRPPRLKLRDRIPFCVLM
jgi:hypothetical protein